MARPRNTIERMLKRDVDMSGECWLWRGPVGHNGYGKAAILKQSLLAHRIFFEHYNGPVSAGHVVVQSCKNRLCVKPAHLVAMPEHEKVARGNSPAGINARKTACIRGHQLIGGNLYVTPNGRRQCRTCLALASRKNKRRARKEEHHA